MNIELVTIGTELLLGFTIDTNGAEIARRLAAVGVRVVQRASVGDQPDDIRAAVREALGRTGAVITTGGLGPTRDDITKRVIAELYGWPLEFDPAIWASLLERFARARRTPAASNRSQAEVPRGAVVLANRWGTAPGLWLEGEPGLAVMLPGVPVEMRNLMEHEVVPRLQARSAGTVIQSRTVRTSGIAESSLAERMGEIESAVAPLTLAYLPGVDGVDLRFTAWNVAPETAEAQLDAAVGEVRHRAGEFAYGEGSEDLAALVVERARRARVRIGTAESCTGGLVAARLTAVPGSSDVFNGSVVAYGNDVKRTCLGVPETALRQHGAVSAETASAMALGALAHLGVGLAVSVTGIAGPDGGSADKPVGTVWFGIAGGGGDAITTRSNFIGSRDEIRSRAAQAALFLLFRRLADHAG